MADTGESTPAPLAALAAAQSDPAVARIYANGFAVGLTNADAVIVLQLSGHPVAIVNLSYTLAKTLAQRLGRIVAELETAIDTTLVTTDKIDEVFKEKKKSEEAETTKH